MPNEMSAEECAERLEAEISMIDFYGLMSKASEKFKSFVNALRTAATDERKIAAGELREVVHCGECEYCREEDCTCINYFGANIPESGRIFVAPDDFCSFGKRKDET